MKAVLCLLLTMIAVVVAKAANPIPDDLVGVWADKAGGGFLMLRGDGLALMAGTVGGPVLAMFEPKDGTLTLTARNDADEVIGQIVLRYEAQSHQLAGLRFINYIDPTNPKGKAAKPREEPFQYRFELLGRELDEHFRSLDRERALKLH
jgi:hypothetical protein